MGEHALCDHLRPLKSRCQETTRHVKIYLEKCLWETVEEVLSKGGWGNFISDAGLTPKKGKKKKEWRRDEQKEEGPMHLKIQGNSEDLLGHQ